VVLDPHQRQRVAALFDRCRHLTQEDCNRILAEECSDDAAVRETVGTLISSARSAGEFLETPLGILTGESGQRSASRLVGRVLNDRFTVLALIGAGGMGEVYRARDERLGRIVAIKVLRPELVQDARWRLRFEQEARAISSLSHAHICTLYDLQQVDDLAYLVMEYLSGETLRDRISRGLLPLADLSRLAIQIAEALAYAHQHGIIHRDLKPSNVLLTESGVKLVDFGLAKQIKLSSEDSVTAFTAAGSILGTIAYMSPEQAQGQILDARSDVFSFGSVLYEMATGRRAFLGDTPLSTLAAILHFDPIPASELADQLPHALDNIVCRCLQKSPTSRYENMREVLSELNSIDEPQASRTLRDTRSLFRPNFRQLETRPYSEAPARVPARHFYATLAAAALVFICVATFGIVWWRNSHRIIPFENTQITKLTGNGTAIIAAVSPDGDSIAYVTKENGALILRLKPTRGGQSMILASPISDDITDLSFTGNGAYVSVVTHPSNQPAMRALQLIPVRGGSPQQVMDTFSGPVRVSQDGKQVAYLTANGKASRDELWISDVGGTKRRLLRSFQYPERFSWTSSFEWSPDGRMLACPLEATDTRGFFIRLAVIETENGRIHQIQSPRWQWVQSFAWMKTSGLITLGQEQDSSFQQIWYLPYPRGKARRLTNDPNDYSGVSLDSNGTSLISVQVQALSNIYISKPEASSEASQITSGSGRYFDLFWLSDGRILYASDATGSADLWIMNADASGQRQLTSAFGRSYAPAGSPDSKYVVFHSNRSGNWNIWRVNTDGGDIAQLTADSQDSNWPQVTPDGNWVVYHHTGLNGMWNLFEVPVKGGKPQQLTGSLTTHPAVSWKDGRIASWYSNNKDKPDWKLAIFPPTGGLPLQVFDIASSVVPDSTIRWTPRGDGITFLDSRNGASNIWLQPLDGSRARPLTSFTSGQIYSFAWSLDGRLAFSRGMILSDVVVIRDRESKVD
jgi:serine/threonine protein kinase/Tol biopolymer transport system component